MACRYYNEEKTDPWNGIYCNYMGGRPGVKYWSCYCDGNSSRCPILGGDDPYELDPETVRRRREEEERKRREEEERRRRERERQEEQERIRERERQEEQERYRRNVEKREREDLRKRSSGEQNAQQYSNLYRYEPDKSSDYTARTGRNYRSSSSGTMFKVILVLVGLLVLVGGGWYAGAKMGWIKSSVTVTAQAPSSGLIPVYEVSLRAVVQDGAHKESTAQFDESGQCKLKLHPGMNAVFVEYDGTSVYLDSYLGNGFKNHEVDLNLDIAEKLMLRILIVELQDDHGTPLYPENVNVVDADGEIIQCKAVQEGMYAMMFGNGTSEENFTISVDGYEALDVSVGLSGRMSHMVITLAEK